MRSALAVAGALFIFLVDQIAKYNLAHLSSDVSLVFGPITVTPLINQKIAFSLPVGSIVIIGLIIVALIFVSYMYLAVLPRRAVSAVAFGLIWGGSLSNISDRLRFGGVVDFLQIGISPIFNFADLGITIGLLCFFLLFLKKEKQKDASTTTRPPHDA